ncbi:flagellar hook-associated protein FlgL [Colwellia sp. E2M01]|uniref:flagellar hook-associated protein FlgL n=1 Tax=Colwellia sp. E2M01 TaxID=2841561 RepID=UPI001C0A07CD|nr:flagellar hook-associated protein FlgL [Colwellia sp. E2M01]MBU2869980.1 flagellar hook-associated protein FlgL [Colwellia sp. E2M01]
MRVSTSQFYYQSAQQLSKQQVSVSQQGEYISAGKRVLTAKDDAVAYGTLSGLKNDLANIEQYQRNITQSINRNSLQDVSFTSAEDIMQQLKQTFIQANNGAYNDDDLDALENLAQSSLEQLLDIANTKDETGGYIFAGYQVGTTPFVMQEDNSVSYHGDNGVRELQIAKNIMVDTNQAGDTAFMNVNNEQGDFSVEYNSTSGIALNKAIISDPSAYDTVNFPPEYNFNFTSETDLNVTDALGNSVFSTTTYAPGQTIAFNGVEVQLSGNPLPGDDFNLTPQKEISLFDTVKGIVDWIAVGSSPADSAQHQVEYQELLGQLDQALNHMTKGQVESGLRLSLLENQQSNHLDSTLALTQGTTDIEALDYAKAASDFEQSKVSLQAAQQTFVQIKSLSLFNYL